MKDNCPIDSSRDGCCMQSNNSLIFWIIVLCALGVYTATRTAIADVPTEISASSDEKSGLQEGVVDSSSVELAVNEAVQTAAVDARQEEDVELSQLEKLQAKIDDKVASQKETQKRMHETAIGYAANCHNNLEDSGFGISQSGDPVTNLLKTASENDLRIDSLYCALRILNNASKGCEYVRDSALNNTLEAVSCYMDKFFSNAHEKNHRKKNYRELEKVIYGQLTSMSDFSFTSPAELASKITKDIFKETTNKLKPSQVKEWQEKMRLLLLRHLENLIGRTLWDVHDWTCIWESVLSSANALYKLSDVLVEADFFDDLLWSLTHRFVWFLDFSAGQLPREFYDNIEHNILDGSAFFLELPEQDNIKNKKTLLLQAVKKAKDKAFSNELFNLEIPGKSLQLAENTPQSEVLSEPLTALFDDVMPSASPVKSPRSGGKSSPQVLQA